MLYRISTEDVNRDTIFAIVSDLFDGYAVTFHQGVFKGVKEKALTIDIVGNDSTAPYVAKVAQRIAIANKQESVLVQRIENTFTFITTETKL